MLNPKETLQKIAEALNIVAKDEAPVVETAAEVPTPEAPVADPAAEAPAVEPVAVAAPEPEAVPEVAAEPVVSEREAELAKQVEDLKGILAEAMKQPEAPVAEPEPKGLTHSPEAVVKKSEGRGVGNKGASIQERVFKYINN